MDLESLAKATSEQIDKIANILSRIFSKLSSALPVRAEEPLPTLDLQQLYQAVRIVDQQSDVHVAVDVTVPAGYSGWTSLALPANRLCIQRYGTEWGDPVVRLKWAIDTKERVACKLHNVPSSPQEFQFAKYWVKRNVLYLYFENTDENNAAEFHLSVLAVMPTLDEWDRWGAKVNEHARRLLE